MLLLITFMNSVALKVALTSVLVCVAGTAKAKGKAKGKPKGPPPEKSPLPAKAAGKPKGPPPGKGPAGDAATGKAAGPPPKAKKSAPPPQPEPLTNQQATYIMNHLRYHGKDGNATNEYGKACAVALKTFKGLGEHKRKEFYDHFMNEKGEKDPKKLKGLTHSFTAVHESSNTDKKKSRQTWVTVTQLMQEFGLNLSNFASVQLGCEWAHNKWRKNAEKHKTAESHPPQMDTEELIDSTYFFVFDDGLQSADEEKTGSQWASFKDYGKANKGALEDMARGSAAAGPGGVDVKIENQEYRDMSGKKDDLRMGTQFLLATSRHCPSLLLPRSPLPFPLVPLLSPRAAAGRRWSSCRGSRRI